MIRIWQLRFRIGPAEPRALGVNRFMVAAVPATASLTISLSGFNPLLFSALAIADLSVLATSRADLRGTTPSTASACWAGRPWICRTTSRIFCADIRTLRVIERTSIKKLYLDSALAVCDPCFLKVRVNENSPRRCPTMFSVTNTGLKMRPLCTLKVCPTKSGVIIERLDQVLIGRFKSAAFNLLILSNKCSSTNGPFLIERPIGSYSIAVSSDVHPDGPGSSGWNI